MRNLTCENHMPQNLEYSARLFNHYSHVFLFVEFLTLIESARIDDVKKSKF